jgi:hypothetical protein
MSTATGNYVSDNSTLAHFQSWTSAIYNAFIAFGWLQTSDTGQAANPIAAVPSSAYAYWIFQAADSLASTLPIYVKIELGYSSTSPRIQITVGTGSSGAGIITGVVCSSVPWLVTGYNANCGANTYPCYFSGDAGNFRMYLWQSINPYCACVFGICRSVNSSGAYTSDYVTVVRALTYQNGYGYQQSLTPTAAGNMDDGILGLALTNQSNTGAWNGTVASLPIFPVLGACKMPLLDFQTCVAADISDGSTVSVSSLYGTTHTMIGISAGYISSIVGQRNNAAVSMALLMRYE